MTMQGAPDFDGTIEAARESANGSDSPRAERQFSTSVHPAFRPRLAPTRPGVAVLTELPDGRTVDPAIDSGGGRPPPPEPAEETPARAPSPLDFHCERCEAPIGEGCRGAGKLKGGAHAVRRSMCPDPDPICARTNWQTNARCKSRRSSHMGEDLTCPDGGGTFAFAIPRGQASFTESEVVLLDKLVRGVLHGRELDAALAQDAFPSLRAKVNGLSAQVARRKAERGDS